MKIVHRTGVELEVYLEVRQHSHNSCVSGAFASADTCAVMNVQVDLDRKPVIGQFLDKVDWDDSAKAFACSATDGNLYVHEVD